MKHLFKFVVIVIVLLVSASASAQEQERSPLRSFVEFWQKVAVEAERQNREFCDTVDETTNVIVSRNQEVREMLSEAGRKLQGGKIPEFIVIMNRAEVKIRAMRNELGVSTRREIRAYNRLLELAAHRYVKPNKS